MAELKLILNLIDKSAILLKNKKIIEIRNFNNESEATLMVYKNIKIDTLVIYSLFEIEQQENSLLSLIRYYEGQIDEWQYIEQHTFDVIKHLAQIYNVKEIQFFTALDYYNKYLINSEKLWIVEPYGYDMCSLVRIEEKQMKELRIMNHLELIEKIKGVEEQLGNLQISTSKIRNPKSIINLNSIKKIQHTYLGFLDLIENNEPIYTHTDMNAPFVDKYTTEYQEKMITKEIYDTVIKESLKNIPVERKMIYFKKGINIQRTILEISLAILTIAIVTLIFVFQNKSTILADITSRENNIKATEIYLEQLNDIVQISEVSNNISAKKILDSVYLYFKKENIKAIKLNNTDNTVNIHLKYDNEEDLYEAINQIGDEFRLQPTDKESILPDNEIQLILDYVNQN